MASELLFGVVIGAMFGILGNLFVASFFNWRKRGFRAQGDLILTSVAFFGFLAFTIVVAFIV